MTTVLEIVSFSVKDGIDTEAFLKASAEMEQSFAQKQDGFIERTLAKDANNQWVDVVVWQSMEAATNAAKNAMESPACAPFFGMIDEESINMSHYSIV